MKVLYITTALIIIIFLVTATGSNDFPKKIKPISGVFNNRLLPCPSSPNCVCSEFSGEKSSIAPMPYTTHPDVAWSKALKIILSMDGQLISSNNGYIHAVFTSRIFGFIDDVELRLDRDEKVIHFRSASRTGYFDFGVNLKRVDLFRKEWKKTGNIFSP